MQYDSQYVPDLAGVTSAGFCGIVIWLLTTGKVGELLAHEIRSSGSVSNTALIGRTFCL
ncbi:MAG TPA: hypothetical protein VFN11_00735 [Ktedonobacterales bacterium]|nr:hypothetical protein [Ktedonobacterales bacterium]